MVVCGQCPHEFIEVGAMRGQLLYEVTGFGVMNRMCPYEFIGAEAMNDQCTYECMWSYVFMLILHSTIQPAVHTHTGETCI